MKNFSNFTFSINEPSELLSYSRKLNIYISLIVIIIGLIGHSLIIFVFGQSRFRTNPSNVFIFCLAMNDALYLVVHFFDDTLRTYIDLYLLQDSMNSTTTNSLNGFNNFLFSINFTDKYIQCCKLVNYLRYVLRFISPYILVLFTFQRLLIVFKPLSTVFIFKKYAWGCVSSIIFLSLIINIWALFFYDLNLDEESHFCDVNRSKSKIYFRVSAVYIFITILIPVLFVFISNLFIIVKLNKTENQRRSITMLTKKFHPPKTKTSTGVTNLKKILDSNEPATISVNSQKIIKKKPYYLSINRYANRARNTHDDAKYLSRLLFLISTLFVTFNIPYLLSWFWTFYQINQVGFNVLSHENLFAVLQLCEIVYNCNFAMLFFVYCASGSKFRNQLKYSAYSNKSHNARVEFYLI